MRRGGTIQCHVLESVGNGAIIEGVDSDEDKGVAGWGQVARLLATPKEVSWLVCPPSQ